MITGSTPLYAVLGHPARHSLSPLLHNHWIEEHGYDGVYVAMDIDPVHFELTLEGLFHAGVQGLNVTSPFKERAAAKAMTQSQSAVATSSVNCLTAGKAGFHGDSTDGDGFIADLDARAIGWRDKPGRVVVLGAGGASRALLYALGQVGYQSIHLLNRHRERALETAKVLPTGKIVIGDWNTAQASLEGASLIINATSAGMNGQSPLELDLSATDKDCLVYDTVYVPRETGLLTSARAQRRQTLDGLGMLVGQGSLAFEKWFGVRPDIKAGLAYLEGALRS